MSINHTEYSLLKYLLQCSATFLYSSTAVGQLRNIPGNANHSHRVLSIKNVIWSDLPLFCTTQLPLDICATWAMGMLINHSHIPVLHKNFICKTLLLSRTTQLPGHFRNISCYANRSVTYSWQICHAWDSYATYLDMPIPWYYPQRVWTHRVLLVSPPG